MTTANSAWSTRRRRSSSDGKNDPVRSFGIRSSRSPAVVDRPRPGPLRCAVRVRCVPGFGADPAVSSVVDQRLVHRLGRDPDPFVGIGRLSASRSSSRAEWSKAIVRRVLP